MIVESPKLDVKPLDTNTSFRNQAYAAILRAFRDRTGLPVLVNTSFNVHEEPIVNRPAECVRALLDRRIDFVVTEQAVYEK